MKLHSLSFFAKVLTITLIVEALLFADFLTTCKIFSLGGIELNPIVNTVGFVPISILKMLGGAFVGVACYYGKKVYPLALMLCVFSFAVTWNINQIAIVT
ncbi:MAG: hypothetical protein NWF01_06720 [Candidatus Bathyarchaeota archaeon]|nr:hypothetical protein [Candidatus Bathyarchaeota archaeon]